MKSLNYIFFLVFILFSLNVFANFNIMYLQDALEINYPVWKQNRSYEEVVTLLSQNDENEFSNFVKNLKKNAKILDIGFGEGLFLNQLKLKRPDLKTIGVSSTGWEYEAAKTIDEIYIQRIPDDLTLLKEHFGTLELITDVFGAATYAENPFHAILYSAMLLKPGGRYYAVVWSISINNTFSPLGSKENHNSMIEFFKKKLGIALNIKRKKIPVRYFYFNSAEVLLVFFEKSKNYYNLNNFEDLINEANQVVGIPTEDQAWLWFTGRWNWAHKNYEVIRH